MDLRDEVLGRLGGRSETEQALRDLADECTREGGSAWLMEVQPRAQMEADAYRQLFDRSQDFADLHSSQSGDKSILTSFS